MHERTMKITLNILTFWIIFIQFIGTNNWTRLNAEYTTTTSPSIHSPLHSKITFHNSLNDKLNIQFLKGDSNFVSLIFRPKIKNNPRNVTKWFVSYDGVKTFENGAKVVPNAFDPNYIIKLVKTSPNVSFRIFLISIYVQKRYQKFINIF
ncbi:hypothetical protein RF11_06753 [Thelohanellus kitauei]|uniref:Uncharacterized protein n=1 Tax=Thelohanellus kitauei TaxID=669202 RepID=A0A0C2MVV8_THEKT|nr:hypothetical protein RF11_06753 [Thelohanellus kitauei]